MFDVSSRSRIVWLVIAEKVRVFEEKVPNGYSYLIPEMGDVLRIVGPGEMVMEWGEFLIELIIEFLPLVPIGRGNNKLDERRECKKNGRHFEEEYHDEC